MVYTWIKEETKWCNYRIMNDATVFANIFTNNEQLVIDMTDALNAAENNVKTYSLEFSSKQWEEIEAASVPPFVIVPEEPMTRVQWVGVGHILMGRASRIRLGEYGPPDKAENFDPDEWSQELDDIANVIFAEFQPGDGKI